MFDSDIYGGKINVGDRVRIVGNCKKTLKCFGGMGSSMKAMRDKREATYTVDYTKPQESLVHLEEGFSWHSSDLMVVLEDKDIEDPEPRIFQFDEKCLSV